MTEQRWTIFRIERGEGMEPWVGVKGPATNPPDDSGLTGDDWCRAAEMEVVPATTDLQVGGEAARKIIEGLIEGDGTGLRHWLTEDLSPAEIAGRLLEALKLLSASPLDPEGEQR